jgi:hypothetical protein
MVDRHREGFVQKSTVMPGKALMSPFVASREMAHDFLCLDLLFVSAKTH